MHTPWPERVAVLILAIFLTLTVAFTLWASVAPSAAQSVPRCTDAIADAGGICHGEPLPES